MKRQPYESPRIRRLPNILGHTFALGARCDPSGSSATTTCDEGAAASPQCVNGPQATTLGCDVGNQATCSAGFFFTG